MTIVEFTQRINGFKDIEGRTWSEITINNVFDNNQIRKKPYQMVVDVIDYFINNADRTPNPKTFGKKIQSECKLFSINKRNRDKTNCDKCQNTGLLVVDRYKGIGKDVCRPANSEPPEWFTKLNEPRRMEAKTSLAVKCPCGNNSNPIFRSYNEMVKDND